jgi:hypothetical protein
MIVWVGYVKSWRHMGSATVSCISGCRCQQVVVDGMHGEGNTQQHMAKLFATQEEECLVEVRVRYEGVLHLLLLLPLYACTHFSAL